MLLNLKASLKKLNNDKISMTEIHWREVEFFLGSFTQFSCDENSQLLSVLRQLTSYECPAKTVSVEPQWNMSQVNLRVLVEVELKNDWTEFAATQLQCADCRRRQDVL